MPSIHLRRPAGTSPRRPGRVFLPGFLLSLVAALLACHAAAGPLASFSETAAGDAEARSAIVAGDPAAFAAEVDSALAVTDPGDESAWTLLREAAASYLAATGDSLLLWDLRAVSAMDAAARGVWYEGVLADAEGLALRGAGDPVASAEAYRRAAERYRDAGDLRREAVAWGSLGVSHWYAGDFAAVREAYLLALDARRRLGDPVLVGRTLNGLGSVHLQLGDLDAALSWYEQARAVRETLDDRNDLATTLAYIGNVRYYLGDLVGAREGYLRSLEVFDETASARSVTSARLGLANVHYELGEYDEALDLYRQQAGLLADVEDAQGEALSRRNAARCLFDLKRHEEALRDLGAAVAVQEETDRFELASSLNLAGMIHMDLGDNPRALENFTQALGVARETENTLVAGQAGINLALVYTRMGLHDRALETLEEARATSAAEEDSLRLRGVLAAMATAYEQKGDAERALETSREVLDIDERSGFRGRTLESRLALANQLESLDRFDEARREYAACLALASDLGRRDIEHGALLGTAHTYERQGRLEEARVDNARAIKVLESIRGAGLSEASMAAFSGKQAYVYEAQVHVLGKLAALGDPSAAEEALLTAESGKARALLDLLEQGSVDYAAGADPALRTEAERIGRAMSALRYRLRQAETDPALVDSVRAFERRLRLLEREERDVLERMRLGNPALETADPARVGNLEELRAVLLQREDDLLLEYALGDSASYLWAVTRDDLKLFAIPSRDSLEALVQRTRGALVNPSPTTDAAYLDAAFRLYAAVLAPVGAEAARATHVFIVPDGALHFVPFDVLLTRAVAGPAPDRGEARAAFFAELPYALAGKALTYGPSANTLAILHAAARGAERPPAGMDFLGVGDPAFVRDAGDRSAPAAGGELVPLPRTRDEVEAAAARFPRGRTTTLFGEEAAESRLTGNELARYRILHFATHGIVDERRPERSALVLAEPREPGEDGYLQAAELYRLRLAADLAVLSACETGLGRLVRGEGVLGLPRAFFFSGVPRVVVSLWRVSDDSTAELMESFYRRLADGLQPVGEALAGAKQDLRNSGDFSHPFYWAPFVAMGSD